MKADSPLFCFENNSLMVVCRARFDEENFPAMAEPLKRPTMTITAITDNHEWDMFQASPLNTKAGISDTIPIPIFLQRSI